MTIKCTFSVNLASFENKSLKIKFGSAINDILPIINSQKLLRKPNHHRDQLNIRYATITHVILRTQYVCNITHVTLGIPKHFEM